MRGWITGVMLVTFLSGGMSGFVAGRASAPERKDPTVVDNLVEDLRRAGVDRDEDLQKAREIWTLYFERVKDLKGKVKELFDGRLRALAMDAEGRIEEILATYPESTGSAEEN
ncbi:MAG: hypothetical protein ABFS86_08190 [Planctomycetota bacterium]